MMSFRVLRDPRSWLFLIFAIVAAFLIFVLPLWFPPAHPTFSNAYSVGFNNRIATLATLGLSVIATGALFWRRKGEEAPAQAAETLSRAWLYAAFGVSVVYTVVFAALMLRSGSSTADVDYFTIPLAEVAYEHGRVYQTAEFAYGPLMFKLPAALQGLFGGAGQGALLGYLAADLIGQLAGLAIIFYAIQQLPLRRGYKLVALGLALFGALRPALGVNYTMLRFGTGLALFLWVVRREGLLQQAMLFGLGQVITLAISPEIGLSFFAGAWAYALVRAVREERRCALLALGPVLGAVLFFAVVDRGYVYVISHFATGMLNLVIAPEPHILVLLVATLGMAPLAVATLLRRPAREAATAAGVYLLALATLPAALGLCDDLHTFFNGTSIFLLSIVAASQRPGAWSRMWVAALFLVTVAVPVADSVRVFRSEAGRVYRPDPQEEAIAALMERQPAGETLYVPTGAPADLRSELMRTRRWTPSYFSGLNNAYDVAGDRRKRLEVEKAAFVLIPAGEIRGAETPDNRLRIRLLRFGYTYKSRRAPYQPLTLVRGALDAEFRVVGSYQLDGVKYLLYQRR